MLELTCHRALIIAPHPDDEVFGCGGLIRRLKKQGTEVYVLYMTVGRTQDFSKGGRSDPDERMAEIEEAAAFMELDGYSMALAGDEYHLQLDAVPQKKLVHAIERGSDISLEAIRPDILLTPSNADYNQDHRAVNTAAVTATRPTWPDHKSFQPAFLTYELPYHQWNIAETLPNPALLVRLDEDDLAFKTDAMRLYGSQLKDLRNPLSLAGIETLAKYRGLQCGAYAAEAFQISRLVI